MPIRRAVPSDIPAIVNLGIEALNRNAYEDMVISRDKIQALALECVSSARHFAWVAERDGEIGGAVVALVHECAVYERQQASVAMFYCRIPGEGIAMLRELVKWWKSRPALKMLAFSIEHDADPRIGKLLHRLGLRIARPSFIATR